MFASKVTTLFLAAMLIMPLAFAAGFQKINITKYVPKEALVYPVGLLNPDAKFRLAIGLPLRDEAGREQLIKSLFDPNSPNYRHWLTPKEYTRRFGPTQADYDKVAAFFISQGFKVTRFDNRALLDIEGEVKMVEATFHITLREYKHPTENREFFMPDEDSASINLDIPISSITGFSNFTRPCPAWGCGSPTRTKVE